MSRRKGLISSDEISTGGGGVGFCGFLTLIFITLKLTNNIDWSWWWVLSPLWIPVAIVLAVAVVVILLAIIAGFGKGE